jgi:hypothetical protein
MRTVVGLILLLLAACLAELGLYFSTAPRLEAPQRRVSGEEITPPVQTSARPESDRSDRQLELARADADAERAAEQARAEAETKRAADEAARQAAERERAAREVITRSSEQDSQQAKARQAELERREADAKRAAEAKRSGEDSNARRQAELEQAFEEARRDSQNKLATIAGRARQADPKQREADAKQAPIEPPTTAEVDDLEKNIKPYRPPQQGEHDKSKDLAQIVENRRRIEQLPKGDIVLDGPSAMKVSDTRAVHANVGVNVPIETLRGGLRPGSQVDEGKLAVSRTYLKIA